MRKVKLGFSNSIYNDFCLPLDEVIAKGKRIGYDGLELNPEASPRAIDVSAIKRALGENEFEIAAIGTKTAYLKYGSYLASPLEERREFVLHYVEDCCRLAEGLNCSIVQLGIALQGSRLEEDKYTARKRLIAGLKEICETASDRGITILVEPLNRFLGQLLNTFDEASEIVNAVGTPNIKLMGDLFHMNIEERSIEDSIRKSAELLKYLHVNDSNRLAPGEGHLNFEKILSALNAISYSGYITVEIIPKPSPDDALTKSIRYLKELGKEIPL